MLKAAPVCAFQIIPTCLSFHKKHCHKCSKQLPVNHQNGLCGFVWKEGSLKSNGLSCPLFEWLFWGTPVCHVFRYTHIIRRPRDYLFPSSSTWCWFPGFMEHTCCHVLSDVFYLLISTPQKNLKVKSRIESSSQKMSPSLRPHLQKSMPSSHGIAASTICPSNIVLSSCGSCGRVGWYWWNYVEPQMPMRWGQTWWSCSSGSLGLLGFLSGF